jgi:hypothetical protein
MTEAITPEVAAAGTSIAELERHWGISRNALKARAKALGVQLQRISPKRTDWPADRIADGEALHRHLEGGGTLRSFPGAVSGDSAPSQSAGGAITKRQHDQAEIVASMASVLAPLIERQQRLPDHLRVARELAAAADEGLPLTSEELAGVLGREVHEVEGIRTSRTMRGFRLRRRGGHTDPDRTYWQVERTFGTGRAIGEG